MRRPQYLSPTAMSLWEKSEDEFYMAYLSDDKPPREPQTQPMSIGSAFDAYTKSFLHQTLFGKGNDPRFDFQALFEAQVESCNRDWAIKHGAYAFSVYKSTGALSDLLLELQAAVGTPRFELDIKGVIQGHREGFTKNLGGATLLGKPDCFYINKHGAYVVLDWKVNGWCSSRNVSPMPGYCKMRASQGAKPTGPHKDCLLGNFRGSTINIGTYLENLNSDWARQLAVYAWLLGLEVGETFISAIDQLACAPSGMEYPLVRVAEHKLRVGQDFQWKVFAGAEELWEIVHSDHIFRDLSKEDSQQRCRMLDQQASALCGKGDPMDAMFAQMTLPKRAW